METPHEPIATAPKRLSIVAILSDKNLWREMAVEFPLLMVSTLVASFLPRLIGGPPNPPFGLYIAIYAPVYTIVSLIAARLLRRRAVAVALRQEISTAYLTLLQALLIGSNSRPLASESETSNEQ